jgi:gamma-D-glutamyl-L-lysine dipeptidyl-peptidase
MTSREAPPDDSPDARSGGTAYVTVPVATVWTASSSPRAVDLPALGRGADIREWLANLSPERRADLITGGLTQTQALYGDRVTVLDQDGDWCEVAVAGQPSPKHPRGYPGWVPGAQLACPADFAALHQGPFAQVDAVPVTRLHRDESLASPAGQISAGTRLPVLGEAPGAIAVATPGGESRWVAAGEVSVYRRAAEIPRPTGADLLATAELFLGVPTCGVAAAALPSTVPG